MHQKNLGNRNKAGKGAIQKKILLLLLGGLALGLSASPRRQFTVVKKIEKEWKDINRDSFQRAIKSLYQSRLVGEKHNSDGTVTLVITESGKKVALTYNLETMQIKAPAVWDKKWRIVSFDIPEKYKKGRDALRRQLKDMGMSELQKSVFIHPYPCKDEINFVVEFFSMRPFVRFVVADEIDNALHLKSRFQLS